MIGRQSEVAPFTFAGAPLDEWDKIQLAGDLGRRRRERLENRAAGAALTLVRIKEHSEADELHAEGEQ